MFQQRLNNIATRAALICVTGLGLGISSQAFAVAPTVSLTAPAANARYGAPAAITLTATATNTGDTISKVEFYQGATLLGTATTAPYSYNWSNVTTGSYSLTAKATNSHNESKTSTAIAVVVNNAPTVSITAPANNSSVAGKATITLTANATDADGTISKVEFYNGTTLLNSDTAAPYSYSWTNVAPGTYSITAKATDNLSGTTTSTPVSITVTNPITVNVTAPANNASVTVGTPIAITATAADSKGSISKVEFYNGTTLLGSATASPYSYSWINAAIGTYSLTAKVTDSQSLTQTSTPVSVQVKAAATTPPTVSLTPALKQATQTAPANGTFIAPAGISLAATATPASGSTISKVEFYQGATLIGTATAPTVTNGTSYSVNWTNVTANSYNVTAKATDNKNATATTAPVTVNVINNSAPTVSLTANPANGTAPATIILNATATDTDGTIAQVEFLNGTNSIATVTQAPYTTNWANVGQVSYSLTAKATDNLGASTTSAAVPVAVTANTPKAYDIHADHLNTPRVITDATGTEVWRWDSAPFGETLPNEQPANQPTKFVFNQRFPGQYYDQETGLHYNYFRDYDPLSGRYVESDPIGLNGGINTYGYVGGKPMSRFDSLGLVDIYVGGAYDGSTKIVSDWVSKNVPDAKYYEWTQGDEISDYIKNLPMDEPVNIYGHSYGGDTAAWVAIRAKGRINSLTTLDPVSQLKPPFKILRCAVGSWRNVNATPPKFDSSDYIAWAGDKWGFGPKGIATSFATAKVHHANFSDLMRAVDSTSNVDCKCFKK